MELGHIKKGKTLFATRLINQTRTHANLVHLLSIVLAIFSLILCMSATLHIHFAQQQAQKISLRAIDALDNYITETTKTLDWLASTATGNCERSDILNLRSQVFHSNMIKEIGLYNNKHFVYCTSNEGATSIRLYGTILNRIGKSQNEATISLTQSKSEEQAFYIYKKSESGNGANALLPPNQLVDLIKPLFHTYQFQYSVWVMDKEINPIIELTNEPLYHIETQSKYFPISINVSLTQQSYFNFFVQNIWGSILIASLFTVLYLVARNRKLSKTSLEASLANAIKQNQLEIHIQPIVDLKSNNVVGGEALVRWNDPKQGMISPGIFIPLAEKLGLIEPITKRVFQLVKYFYYTSQPQLENLYLSINISRSLILDPHFIHYLERFSNQNPELIEQLLLEITEDNNFTPKELEQAIGSFRYLSNLGYKLAVDDFGTGYSGLNFIHQFNFKTIKIDQVFVRSLQRNSNIMPVFTSMIELGSQLDMGIIVEGVETREQLELLTEMGVQYIQGFYYSKPLPVPQFLQYINKDN